MAARPGTKRIVPIRRAAHRRPYSLVVGWFSGYSCYLLTASRLPESSMRTAVVFP